MTRSVTATLGYVGSAGAQLSWAPNINEPNPGPGAIDPRRQYASVLPGVSAITCLESAGNSFFSSLQASVEKRWSKGFYLLANWTWAHGLDNIGGDGGANGPIPQDPTNRRADWATSNSDIRHRINIAATYQLPFGPGRPFANGSSVASYLIRDWEVGGIVVLQSGLPYTVTVSGSPSNTGAGSRANVVAGVNPIPAQQSIAQWFNPAAFATPPAFTWGTLGRNSLTGPAIYNLDATVSRKFRLGEQRELGFRWELFNTLNHPQFGLPNSTAGVGPCGNDHDNTTFKSSDASGGPVGVLTRGCARVSQTEGRRSGRSGISGTCHLELCLDARPEAYRKIGICHASRDRGMIARPPRRQITGSLLSACRSQ